MNKTVAFILCLALAQLWLIAGCQSGPADDARDSSQNNPDQVFQVSTINALMQGVYEGDCTFSTVEKHGDLGIGTFQSLDGEMVMLDGVPYQVKADGKVYSVPVDMKTPFAVVTYYETDASQEISNIESLTGLQASVEPLIKNRNLPYAIKIEGTFKYIKVRSVPAQSRPYPLLTEVVKNQKEYQYNSIDGTIVGFWIPAFMEGINVPGYHLHFISKDRSCGGHLLECQADRLVAGVDMSDDIDLDLPANEDFARANITTNQSKDVNKVEGKN